VIRLGWWLLTTAIATGQYSCHYSSGGTSGSGASSGASPAHSHSLAGLLVMGFGALLVYGGRQNYQKLRLLGAMPMTAIRSLGAGLVHILGKAVGEDRLVSPLTRQPCFYYQVIIERPGGRGSRWAMCLRHTEHRRFYLEDASGKVLVDLHRAQLDVTQTFQTTIGPAAERGQVGASGHSDWELRDYLSRTHLQIQTERANRGESLPRAIMNMEGSVSMLPADFSALDAPLHLRFTETCVLVDRDYNILGTCLENPHPNGEEDRKIISWGQNKNPFLISCKSEPELEKSTRRASYLCFALGGVFVAGGLVLLFS
jgi:hypothetical protein